MKKSSCAAAVLALALLHTAPAASAAEGAATAAPDTRRHIEDVVVTAEQVQSTVSDTAISITAFSSKMIEELGLQSADEMINYLPATTRDAYDIRIRGVGRNFRALGGDPGVATYYNGIYSPDFGIATSENALYDLARIEVLRGPQGTLYGRNSIGGALNYVTNNPSFKWHGDLRAQLGNLNTREAYGFVTGPLIEDTLAFRLTGSKLNRDASERGVGNTNDINSIDDRNVVLGLLWKINDKVTFLTRANDRKSHRLIPNDVLISYGTSQERGRIDSEQYLPGVRAVPEGTSGALVFIDPKDGSKRFGLHLRPGVDASAFPYAPLAAFHNPIGGKLLTGGRNDTGRKTAVNDGSTGHCDFPYTDSTCQDEYFGHRANQTELTWDVTDKIQLRYLFGYTDFTYTFNIDTDFWNSRFTQYRATVNESVENSSHEIRSTWQIGDKIKGTSGVYLFYEDRDQDFSLTNSTDRYIKAADYGRLNDPVAAFGGASYIQLFNLGAHKRLYSAAKGTSNAGLWSGDTRGDIYHHMNKVHNRATAVYTQVTYDINEHWDIVGGVRYANDRKHAKEVRGGYFEIGVFAPGVLAGLLGVPAPAANNAITALALTNIAMGNATYSGNPSNPLVPVCALDALTCAKPLRLGAGLPISYSSNLADSNEWEDTNFRINVDWHPNDNILMYASVTTGYRAGGFSLGIASARDNQRDANGLPVPGSALVPTQYDKEEVTAYELGYKGTHFDGTLQINSAIYTYDYKNYQDQVNRQDTNRGLVDIVGNAPKARNSGFEIEATWLPTDAITLGGNYSYTIAEYSAKYVIVFQKDPRTPPSLFGTALTRPDLYQIDVNGRTLKRIPKNKSTVWGSYLLDAGFGKFNFSTSVSFTGEFFDSGTEADLERVPGRVRVDASVSFTDAAEKYRVRLFMDNVLNSSAIQQITNDGPDGNWAQHGSVPYPRFFGIDATYHVK